MPAPKKPTTQEDCLKCRKPFQSVDRKKNRLCAKCNYANEMASRIESRVASVHTESNPITTEAEVNQRHLGR